MSKESTPVKGTKEALENASKQYRRVRKDEMDLYKLVNRYNLKADSLPIQVAAEETAEHVISTILQARAEGIVPPEVILSIIGVR